MLRRKMVAALVAAVVLATPGSASAATWYWNSQSSPLPVRSDGSTGTLLGEGYGSVTLTGKLSGGYWSMYYTGRGYLRDRVPGGNSIYWENLVQIVDYPGDAYIKAQSDRWNGSSWQLFTKSKGVTYSAIGHYADINRKVCEDRQFAIDPCNGGWKADPMKFY